MVLADYYPNCHCFHSFRNYRRHRRHCHHHHHNLRCYCPNCHCYKQKFNDSLEQQEFKRKITYPDPPPRLFQFPPLLRSLPRPPPKPRPPMSRPPPPRLLMRPISGLGKAFFTSSNLFLMECDFLTKQCG